MKSIHRCPREDGGNHWVSTYMPLKFVIGIAINLNNHYGGMINFNSALSCPRGMIQTVNIDIKGQAVKSNTNKWAHLYVRICMLCDVHIFIAHSKA